ncbi:hypothetical protein [Subtercola vilae]|uniref:hypothetical protein n=1 Tax=Subtercola vilae TaxID=2056433 RepID=UPI0010A99868|nr:hypothetical protein [Subtercola vilae]
MTQTGLTLQLQLVEVTDDFILIRLRSNEMRPTGHRETQRPALMAEQFTLSDAKGMTANYVQISSGGGPFAGQIDLAFDRTPPIDLTATLSLSSEHTHLTFQV